MKVDVIYFSACGNSENAAQQVHMIVAKDNETVILDVTRQRQINMRGDVLIVVAPVYNDSLPSPLISLINNSQLGYKYYACIATYGGVTYKNSLCSAMQLLDSKGMRCVGLSSIATNHSYITQVADVGDKKEIIKKILLNIYSNIMNEKRVFIKPNNSYRLIKKSIDKNHNKLFPQPTKDNGKCCKCGKCSSICPALSGCINCMACVKNCPSRAISFAPKSLPIVGIKIMKSVTRDYKIFK